MRLDERQVVARVRRARLRELRVWVREGWVRPIPGEKGPMFDDLDVARVRLLCDLTQDISIGSDALPVVLSLLDQVQGLRRELRLLADAVEHQPKPVRRAIAEYCRECGPGRGD